MLKRQSEKIAKIKTVKISKKERFKARKGKKTKFINIDKKRLKINEKKCEI